MFYNVHAKHRKDLLACSVYIFLRIVVHFKYCQNPYGGKLLLAAAFSCTWLPQLVKIVEANTTAPKIINTLFIFLDLEFSNMIKVVGFVPFYKVGFNFMIKH